MTGLVVGGDAMRRGPVSCVGRVSCAHVRTRQKETVPAGCWLDSVSQRQTRRDAFVCTADSKKHYMTLRKDAAVQPVGTPHAACVYVFSTPGSSSFLGRQLFLAAVSWATDKHQISCIIA